MLWNAIFYIKTKVKGISQGFNISDFKDYLCSRNMCTNLPIILLTHITKTVFVHFLPFQPSLTKIEVQIVYFLYTKSKQILYYIGCVYIFSIHQIYIKPKFTLLFHI